MRVVFDLFVFQRNFAVKIKIAMKKLLSTFTAIFLLYSFAVSQEITYKVKSDNPESKVASFSLEPFYMDWWSGDMSLGYSVRADVNILKRIQLKADFRRSYMDLFLGGELPKGHKRTWTELGGALLIRDKKLDRSIKVVLSSSSYSSGGYTYTNTKYIMVPGTVRKQIGLRAGLLNISSPLSLGSNNTLKTVNPLYYTITGDTTKWPLQAAQQSFIGTIHAGVDFNKIYDLVIYADGYGRRRAAMYSNFYIDGILAPYVGLKNVDATKTNLPNYDKVHSDNIKHWGWRMGWVIRHPNNLFLTYKMEFGSMPGVKTSALSTGYFVMTIGLNIPMSINALEKSNK